MSSLLTRGFLSTLIFLFAALPLRSDDKVLADFESATYGEWTTEGTAFGDGPAKGALPNQQAVSGFRGNRFVNSYHEGDRSVGMLTSQEFELDRDYLSFLIGGGRHLGKTGIELLIDGESVRTETGSDAELLRWKSWDVRELKGQTARLRIFDRETEGWGHINVDQIVLTDAPRSGSGNWTLESYRHSAEYYRERYRPQFHFTPELNWMNDPNGLVYHEGEYHLFYQHNPHGNSWGHMSWGHAVSTDLVHWQHLPIALHEEYGVMIFSGSAVVDQQNTSGFSAEGIVPIVAIYTGHSDGLQTQNLAFSLDRGRHWTKYAGNPVLDIGEQDFRDPKVFWHEASSQWVMSVVLAVQKKVRFYGSPDLKDWKLLSEFGPAGAKQKANWECPDLLRLPIEGKQNSFSWVLEADMGSGSIAGGSGGEYFVGDFDGTKFQSQLPTDEANWVDYGRDFYAPVSWSNAPHDRKVWLGWMNNWETCLVPTFPWRSAMSLPRDLSLREVNGKLKLIQRPVPELQKLRNDHTQFRSGPIEAAQTIDLSDKMSGQQLEILARIKLPANHQTRFEFRVCRGADEETLIGYDGTRKEV
ncbi:MAG TPA: glycoside hydrolase family 32 protein, partial [Planctomycetaceae bacterium]|nr:glycoside hydrolase family 32 protein [Planctomycetaceae bacterium]